MKRFFTFLFYALAFCVSLPLLSFATSKAMKIIHEANHEFRFEDYDTEEEAKAALLKLHPIGSPVEELVKTLESSGATVRKIKGHRDEEIYFYEYYQKSLLHPTKWGGGIRYDNNQITINFGVGKEYRGL